MRLTIERDELVRLAARAASVALKNSPGIGSAVLFVAAGDGVSVNARDPVLTILDAANATVATAGTVAVDAHRLAEVARVLPAGSVRLEADDKALTLKAGGSVFRLPVLDSATFPTPDGAGEVVATLDTTGAALRGALRRVLHAVAPDDNRYGLSGVYLECSPLTFVATDGTRLAHVDLASATMDGVPAARTMIPKRAIGELVKLTEGCDGTPVRLEFTERTVTATIASTVLVVRLLEADFPAYREVVPKTRKERVEIDRDVLSAALKRVALIATDQSHTVRVHLAADTVHLSAQDLDGQAASDVLPCTVDGTLTVGVNARLLADALAQCEPGMVQLDCVGALGPIVVRSVGSERTFFVIMPVRLD